MAGQVASSSVLAVATAVATVTPTWLLLSMLLPAVGVTGMEPMRSAPLVALSYVLGLAGYAVSTVGWAVVVAAVAGVARGPMTKGVLRTGLLTLVSVALGIDLSQLLIVVVSPWHRLAVHSVFAVAFTIGLAIFMAVVARRVGKVVAAVALTDAPRLSSPVAVATGAGVVIGAVLAVELGWEVVPGMGMRMLWPLYLVIGTGSLAGGAVLGWHLGSPEFH